MPQTLRAPLPKTPARQVLLDPDSFATTLITLAIDRYGTEMLSWAPETIRRQLEADYAIKLPRQNLDKLLAAVTLLSSDYFYKSLPRFIALCNVLAGDEFDPTVFNPADSAECAWGITEAMLLAPPREAEPFSDEIRAYLGAVLKDEGYVKAPDVLRLASGLDASANTEYDASDSPELFSAIWQTQADKSTEITELLKESLSELIDQLRRLPLEHGDVSGLLAKVPKDLLPD